MIAVAILLAVAYLRRGTPPPIRPAEGDGDRGGDQPYAVTHPSPTRSATSAARRMPRPTPRVIRPTEPGRASAPADVSGAKDAKDARAKPDLHFRVDDGVAVVQGDVAVGVPVDPSRTSGVVQMTPFKTWDPAPIPYYIQPGVEHPERILQALALFANTRRRFVEYSGQEDALVFEPTVGICKSYLGKMGGRQPVWIAPGCGPVEIAHEIMHALGFAHEQNRADRDDYITVNFDGIEDEYRYNFDKLPPEYTKLNQAAPFDFTSIMMYPPWMFAKGGQSTMQPRDPDQRIAPGQRLSPADERRL